MSIVKKAELEFVTFDTEDVITTSGAPVGPEHICCYLQPTGEFDSSSGLPIVDVHMYVNGTLIGTKHEVMSAASEGWFSSLAPLTHCDTSKYPAEYHPKN